MPSEPIEAQFSYRHPVLSGEHEEEFRTLEIENLESTQLGRKLSLKHPDEVTVVASDGTPLHRPSTLHDLEEIHLKEGYKIVKFEKGKGEDPREWSKLKKWYITLTTSILCLAVAIGSSIVTGDMTGPTKTLGIQQEITNLTVTCFVMGFGIGPLFMAPLSEVVGRRPIYCVSMFLYFIFTLPSALAKNAATLVVARMIAGLAASAPMCNVGGSIADVWAIEERGVPMAVFSGTLFIGPCVGPMVAGWIGMYAGWRWIYWVLFIFLGVSFALTLFIPESLAPVLLRRKAEVLRKSTNDDRYRTLEELEKLPFSETLQIALVRPFLMLVQEPIVIFMSCYLSFVYSLLYLLFFAFPIAFLEIRGFSEGMTGITFISIMLGIFFAGLFLPTQEKLYAKATASGSFPEARLYPMMVGAFFMPTALFMFAFTGAYPWVHWIAVCISGFVFGFAMILLYVSANSYIIDSYSDYAASAMAAKTFMRSEIGAMVPLFVNQMFHHMGFQWAGLLLALIACAIAPIPFIFYKYGERIRSTSKRASQLRRGGGNITKA
ncbi:Major facilitator superfamily multidrug transporter NAG4 [Psilocybe cubensis]|uniref:Major facilitator superfamily multidrug transporter NAG4 n=2 Tax=Psilocybe cubensis TaxID=181762 RepID=A0ACB8GTI5_PSICU|nr:Major facilitator superfamily multidrug transporter NAG4 [Psilocybe cubensis]KAH9478677.1 Major facilitator superfamily multidrug transporter NAG4 [Psilocybe cubensis]